MNRKPLNYETLIGDPPATFASDLGLASGLLRRLGLGLGLGMFVYAAGILYRDTPTVMLMAVGAALLGFSLPPSSDRYR
jgi:cyanate permease